MNSATRTVPPALTQPQWAALVSLLGDDDPAVYRTVREKILSFGSAAVDRLRDHALIDEPVIRRRVQELLHFLDCQAADNRFLGFCVRQGEEFDIEQAAWLLAQTRYPEINVDGYRALLDGYAATLAVQLPASRSAGEILGTLNRFLLDEVGLQGNEADYYSPENSYLNRVLDRRVGNPISLCLLYLLVARRLQLPVAGIGMPGHFLCRFQSSVEEIYIDVFHQGRLLQKADCIRYLGQHGHDFVEGMLAPASSRRMVMRMCSNLHQTYLQLKQPDEVSRLQRYLVALAR